MAAGGHLLDRGNTRVGGRDLHEQVRAGRSCRGSGSPGRSSRRCPPRASGRPRSRRTRRGLRSAPRRAAARRRLRRRRASPARGRRSSTSPSLPRDLSVVCRAPRQRLAEDARVRGDADDGVFRDRAREAARLDQVAREEVDPDALAERRKLLEAGHRDLPLDELAGERVHRRALGDQLSHERLELGALPDAQRADERAFVAVAGEEAGAEPAVGGQCVEPGDVAEDLDGRAEDFARRTTRRCRTRLPGRRGSCRPRCPGSRRSTSARSAAGAGREGRRSLRRRPRRRRPAHPFRSAD